MMGSRAASSVTLRRAEPSDAETLTRLVQTSSAYDGEYRPMVDTYVVKPEQILRDLVVVARNSDAILGFYSLVSAPQPELDLMFVADNAQGWGIGRLLFDHMLAEAAERGMSKLRIISHPPAEAFYRRMGAMVVGRRAPTGRISWSQPILEIESHSKN